MAVSASPTLSGLIAEALPRYQTAADLVADTLRKAIVNGAIGSNEPLRQEDLAARFGVSRMPVRDALRRLEAEGLVVFHPRRGAFVAGFGLSDVGEIYELRALLEVEALRLSLPTLTGAAFTTAEGTLDEIDGEADISRWGALNLRFHLALYSGCGRKRLLDLIEAHCVAIDRYVRILLSHLDYREESQAEHRHLLALCRRQEIETATRVLRDHLDGARIRLVNFMATAAVRTPER